MSARRTVVLVATAGQLVAREVGITLTNRGWVFLLQLGAITPPIVSLVVWTGAISAGATPPVPPDRLLTWFVLVAVISMVTSSWTATFLADDIRTGRLSIWLVRPCPALLSLAANNVAEKAVKLLFLVPMVAVLALLLRDDVRLPNDPLVWATALVALGCAAVLAFALDVFIGCLGFWFEDVDGIQRIVSLVSRLLSGAVVPLMLLPATVQPALRFQPFRFTLAFPLELLTGAASAHGADLAAMIAWTIGGALLLALVWRRGIRRYEAAGA
ncbi:ABC transporter permease [Tessaracoccus caeni]|uniref:ABC transporter permease n=1 Tax=Tessaracoccus caeni TaxID=3031239 RepID=UPI0023DBA9B0|nr:ABC-2 family transporter protein [Tessaracoccus caeni]MDF1487975.1 ABC-2 family transporter protein [Tessaracoccus caeni]